MPFLFSPINMTKALYGLIGKELAHSFSPSYFKRKFASQNINAQYQAFPLPDISELKHLLEVHPNIEGLNVTIPYKEEVLPLLTTIDETAKAIGAVNCINITDGKLYGYNTDAIGFKKSLQPLLDSNINKALILGTGGAAKAVSYILEQLGISFRYVSRSKEEGAYSYQELDMDIIREYQLIINTTPLGTYPDIDSFPVLPYRYLTYRHLLYDLVYNPEETKFLKYGKHYGARTKNGYEMLELQAEASWEIWNSN